MEQRVSLLTLGVADYERATAFYTALGWSPSLEVEETAFYEAGGLVFTLWSRAKLSADMGVPETVRWSGIALAHKQRPQQEARDVDRQTAGAEITREPAATFYAGYRAFATSTATCGDRAQPAFAPTEDGGIVLPGR